jgi:bla regulator protein BlaR1
MPQSRGPCATSTPPQSSFFEFLFAAAILLSASCACAQLKHEGPAKLVALSQTVPPYDVASVRINNSGASSYSLNFHDESLDARNVPLEYIIEFAYDVPPDRVNGIPGPLKDQHFDIDAKVVPADGSKPPSTSASEDQAKLILLLADRFHLKVHVEPKIMPVYDLVVAKGGPRVKLSQDELENSNWNVIRQDTSLVLTSKGASIADLAAAVSDQVHRPIIDKTSLTGHADITLKWSDDVAAQQGGPDVVSIFTAIEDQLGLKLASSKGPVDTLVIDHAEMPSAN